MRSIIVLTLIGLFILPTPTLPVPVDPDAPDGIAAMDQWNVGIAFFLCTSGEVWKMTYENYTPVPPMVIEELAPPVPVSEIREWFIYGFITHSGTYWVSLYESSVGTRTWRDHGQVPSCGPPVAADQQSLGSLKQMFR